MNLPIAISIYMLGMSIIVYGTYFLCGTKKTAWNMFFVSGIGSVLYVSYMFWYPMITQDCGDKALGLAISILFLMAVQICIALILLTLLLVKRIKVPRKIGLSVIIIFVLFTIFVVWAVKNL